MENLVSAFFLRAGHAFLVLAIVGVFLPILPTTPFVIAASACYMRSSKRFHAMLHKSKWFGPMLENWERDRSISLRSKIGAVVMIGASLIISFAFFSIPFFCDDFRYHRVRRCIAIHPHEAEPAKIAACG